MTAAQIIHEIDTLAPKERARVIEHIHELDDPDHGLQLTPEVLSDLEEARLQILRGEFEVLPPKSKS